MKKILLWIAAALLVLCGGGMFMLKRLSPKGDAGTKPGDVTAVTQGDLVLKVVESGNIDSTSAVEVKPRVTGRIKALLVDEGDVVKAGQLIATIDPLETKLQLQQTEANLRGAVHGAEKASIEIDQRTNQTRAAYEQAKLKVRQLELEMNVQPKLTSAAIAEAQTALNSAEAEQRRVVDSVHPNQRVQAKNNIREAEVNFATAQSDYDRQVELERKGFVSGKTVELARQALQLAQVRLDQAKDNDARLDAQLKNEAAKLAENVKQAGAALVRAKVNSVQDELKRRDYQSALADLDRAKAALLDTPILRKGREVNLATVDQLKSVRDDSLRQLRETDIRSPLSGIVVKRGLQVGELATGLSSFSSGSTIVKIEDRSAMRVKLDVNEIDVARMTLGMDATIDVDALPGRPFHGVVKKIAPASRDSANSSVQSQATSTADNVVKFQVEIRIVDPTETIRSGMSAKVTIVTARRNGVLIVPIEFVVRDGPKAYVEFEPASPKEKPSRREVKLGLVTGSQAEIVSGVKVGDKLHRPEFGGPKRKGFMEAGGDE